MDKKEYSRPVSLRRVQVTDAFWKQKMELVRKEVIPYQWEALNDRVPDAEPSYCMHNFRAAGKLNARRRELGEAYVPEKRPLVSGCHPEDRNHMEDDRFYGNVFQDSDFFKWIEAAAYSLTQHPDSELEGTVDEAIDAVCAAQLENGYLDTYYIINDMDYVFTNLRDNHELYCFGHLTEAAVAYCQATGKDKLLQAAMRYADYIGFCFGPEEGKRKGYPGHELAELALVRLYEQTGDGKYLELSRFFIEQRGTRPYYYDEEHPETVEKGKEGEIRHWYHQAHLPVREQKEAVGHAVRAVYLYSGMADVARKSNEELANSLAELQQAYADAALTQDELNKAYLEIENARNELTSTQQELEAIVGIRTDIIGALQSAFNNSAMSVDAQTGSITFSSDVLFRYNSAALSADSRSTLKEIIPMYLDVLMQEQFREYIAEIIIEGHTDTDGTYESNMELSYNRAYSVAKFCMDPKNGLAEDKIEQLKGILTVNGRSFSQPIYAADAQGNPTDQVNMEASRRVEIKFRLKEDEMIEKIEEVLRQ